MFSLRLVGEEGPGQPRIKKPEESYQRTDTQDGPGKRLLDAGKSC